MIDLSVLEDIVDTIQKISESRSKTCISKDFFLRSVRTYAKHKMNSVYFSVFKHQSADT